VNAKGRDKSELCALINEIKELLIYCSDLKVTKVKRELIRVAHVVALYATINSLVSSWLHQAPVQRNSVSLLYQMISRIFISYEMKFSLPQNRKKNTIKILIQRSEFLAIEHLCFEDHEDDF
jgi:ABC-type uncharacterized transport system involved in gliding motility auxiliary subunit